MVLPWFSSDSNKSKPPGFQSPSLDTTALVTGSGGLCGARLVEMLLLRGTKLVIAFDIMVPDATLQERFQRVQQQTGGNILFCCGPENGDITSDAAVRAAFTSVSKIDIVYHVAAIVGPFFDRQVYFDVNFHGTKRIIDMCREYKVPKLVYSSSPGTRFTGADIEGLTEEELPIPKTFLAYYAETKAYGEVEVSKACCDSLLTISVAPHQIYGPHDRLFLQKFLEVCGNNRLRIFGTGNYLISVCYVDNYCHGLMCGADQLHKDSKALGKFYIVTDGNEPRNLWQLINSAGVAMGFTDLNTKMHLPVWFLLILATIANVIGFLLNKKFKLNYFSLRMSTMHRYFNINNAQTDLKYEPVVPFEDAWKETIQWFKENWLPQFLDEKSRKTGKALAKKVD
jgi:nucleoside-diphosphate-sugar epimerase